MFLTFSTQFCFLFDDLWTIYGISPSDSCLQELQFYYAYIKKKYTTE